MKYDDPYYRMQTANPEWRAKLTNIQQKNLHLAEATLRIIQAFTASVLVGALTFTALMAVLK